MPSFQDMKYAFFSLMSTIQFKDIIDLLALTYIIYLLLKLVRETRAAQLIKGILLLVAAYFISNFLDLTVMEYILGNALDVGLLAMLILFQPEIRRALEQFGQTQFGIKMIGIGSPSGDAKSRWNTAIEAICDSCVELSASCTGALIVIEQEESLAEYTRTGIDIDAVVSSQLLINIFEHNTPLHDGAVVVRGDRVVSATCILPVTDQTTLNKSMGTRHRAGVGISEVTDSVTVIVSEQTGTISVAADGKIQRNYDGEKLKARLMELVDTGGEEKKQKLRIKKGKDKTKE